MKLSWRDFLAGVLYGAIVTAAGAGRWVWWRSNYDDEWRPVQSAQDAVAYDACLASGKTTVACDALMRVIAYTRAKNAAEQAAILQEVEKKLAEGATKCDVVKWARDTSYSVYEQIWAILANFPGKEPDNKC